MRTILIIANNSPRPLCSQAVQLYRYSVGIKKPSLSGAYWIAKWRGTDRTDGFLTDTQVLAPKGRADGYLWHPLSGCASI